MSQTKNQTELQTVTVIGAANIDVTGRSCDPLILEDSNPGHIKLCTGGVGRNIAENLARLSVNVSLITALGEDVFARRIVEFSEGVGVDMTHAYVKPGGTSSTYLAILENNGEMRLALSDMRILEEIPTEHIDKHRALIERSAVVVLDAGLAEDMIAYILSRFGDRRIFLDPVSVGKAKHVSHCIGGFDTVKLNRLEAEYLSGLPITNRQSLEEAGAYFLAKGVRRVFISMGSDGVFYKTASESGCCPSPHITPVNATGAGDAFMAGIVYCTLQGFNNRDTARFASAMSRIAIMSESTVSPAMSFENVREEAKKMEGI